MASEKRKADKMETSSSSSSGAAAAAAAAAGDAEEGAGVPLLYINDLTPIHPSRSEDLHLVCKVDENERKKIPFKSGKGSLFSVVLRDRDNDIVDPKNKIKLTIFSSCKHFDKWYEQLQLGTVVRIWLGKVKPMNSAAFNKTGHPYELSLGDDSEVDTLSEQVVAENYWTFGGKPKRSQAGVTCDIGDDLLQQTPSPAEEAVRGAPPKLVTILGVVVHTTPFDMGTNKWGGSFQKCKVVLAGLGKSGVEVTLWDRLAELEFDVGQVVLAENLKVSSFNTCTLSSISSSYLEVVSEENLARVLVPGLHAQAREMFKWHCGEQQISVPISDIHMLSKWDRNSASNRAKATNAAEKCHLGDLASKASEAKAFVQQAMQHSASGSVDVSMYHDDNAVDAAGSSFRPVSIPSDIAEQVKTGSYCIRASVVRILGNPKRALTVPCCANEFAASSGQIGAMPTKATKVCGKWVKSSPKGWSCDGCKAELPTCLYNYNVPMDVADAFGTVTVNVYNEAVKAMAGGVSARDMLLEALGADALLGPDSHNEANQLLVDRLHRVLQDREFTFVLKSAADAHRGLKFTSDIVDAVDYDKESELLLASLA